MAGDEDQIDITVDLTDNLSRPATQATKAQEELGEEAREAERRLKALQRQADKAGRSLEFLAVKTKAANMEFDTHGERVSWISNEYTRLTREQKKTEDQTEKFTTTLKKNTKEIKRSGNGFRAFQRVLNKFRSTAIQGAVAVGVLTKGVVALGAVAVVGVAVQNVLSLVSALSSLVSFAAIIPTALSSLIAIFGTLAVATQGVGDALGAVFSGDATAFAEAIKKLSPSTAKLVSEFASFEPVLKSLQRNVQEALFKPLVKQLVPALESVLPVINQGMQLVAGSLGNLAKEFLSFFQTLEGRQLLGLAFVAGADLIKGLTHAVKPLLTGLKDVMLVAMPLWQSFTMVLGSLGEEFGQWLSEIARSGQLQQWIQTAMDAFQILMVIGRDVFDIIRGVIQAAGGGGMQAISEFISRIADFINSDVGQSALTSLFQALGDIAIAVSPLIETLATIIGTTLAPALAEIVTAIAPYLNIFFQQLGVALQTLAPYMGPLAEAVGQLLIALAPLLPVIGMLAGLLAQYLTKALMILAPIIATFALTLAQLLTPFLEASAKAFEMIMPYIDDFIGVIFNLGMQLLPIVSQIAAMFRDHFNKYLQTLAQILPTLIPQLIELAMTFGKLLLDSLNMLMPMMPSLIASFFRIMETVLTLMPVMLPLVEVLLNIALAALPLVPLILQVSVVFLELATKATLASAKIVAAIARFVTDAKGMVSAVTGAFKAVGDAIEKAFVKAKDIVLGIVQDIKNAIGSIKFPDVGGFLDKLNPFRFAGGPVESGTKYTVGEIGPELFVPNTGEPKVVGEHGMETRSFAGDGMIIPNFMFEIFDRIEEGMRRDSDKSFQHEVDTVGGSSEEHYHHHEGDRYEFSFSDATFNSDIDVKKAVKDAIDEIDRDKRERK